MSTRISETNVGDHLSEKLRDITYYANDKWRVFKDEKAEIQ